MALLSAFAGVSLLLTLIGLYGVLSYGVAQRTAELGIRLALGATSVEVIRQVLTQGIRLTLTGLVFGTLAAVAVAQAISRLLFGIRAFDPIAFTAATALLLTVALLASYLPARRAAKVDPIVALRYE